MIPTQHTLDTPYPVGPVHCYSTELNGDLVLFDTGPPTEQAKSYLRQHLDLERLRYVFVTHCHIDHYGLAAWLERESAATIYLPYRDSLKIARHAERLDKLTELLGELGFDHGYLELFRADMDNDSVFPEFPEQFGIVEQELPAKLGLEVLPCAGHSQSDLVYAAETWAVTGDVMLRGIFQSPLLDIDLLTGRRFSNYNSYCASLLKLARLRDKQVCPGHRQSIESVDQNIRFYVGKLLERAATVRTEGQDESVAAQTARLFPHLEHPFMIYLKASELCFLRDFLGDPELLRDALHQIGLFDSLAAVYAQVVG